MKNPIAGTCKLCGDQLANIRQRFVGDHPKAGEPMKFEPIVFNPGIAKRVTVVLSGGSQMSLTFCVKCAPVVQDNLPEIWDTVLNGWVKEMKDEPSEWALNILREVPLGVLHSCDWSEIKDAVG